MLSNGASSVLKIPRANVFAPLLNARATRARGTGDLEWRIAKGERIAAQSAAGIAQPHAPGFSRSECPKWRQADMKTPPIASRRRSSSSCQIRRR
jgi:hypothetical protein